jgi:hypothetical protein
MLIDFNKTLTFKKKWADLNPPIFKQLTKNYEKLTILFL